MSEVSSALKLNRDSYSGEQLSAHCVVFRCPQLLGSKEDKRNYLNHDSGIILVWHRTDHFFSWSSLLPAALPGLQYRFLSSSVIEVEETRSIWVWCVTAAYALSNGNHLDSSAASELIIKRINQEEHEETINSDIWTCAPLCGVTVIIRCNLLDTIVMSTICIWGMYPQVRGGLMVTADETWSTSRSTLPYSQRSIWLEISVAIDCLDRCGWNLSLATYKSSNLTSLLRDFTDFYFSALALSPEMADRLKKFDDYKYQYEMLAASQVPLALVYCCSW